jgi:hypothetical protein
MKNIKKTWFLSHPIDQEHKQYILLDFLQSINKDIKENEIYYSIKKIFSLTKELSLFKRWMTNQEKEISSGTDREIYDFFQESFFSKEEQSEILRILESSLEVLYKYSELGIELWKSIEKRIKAFDLYKGEIDKTYGVIIFRNMATDEIFSYIWSKGDFDKSQGVIMKKVNLRNNFFSMSYEFILHEILQEIGIRKMSSMRVTVMEIQEDCNQDSIIVKIAKELFVGEMDYQQGQKHDH